MVNPDEDILQQFAQEPVVTNDLVDRGELRNVPLEELINVRPDTGQAEGALKLLAGNTTTANDATGGGLNAYRASGASVQPAKSAAEIYNQLHPEAATRIQRFFELADERGLGLKPGSMNRDYGTQAKMYANRASNPYPVAPPGGSAHMGFATDFSGYKPEKLQAIRELAKEVGLVYGGNWSGKTFDPVHIQLGPGSDVTRYIQQHINPQAGTVNWEGVRTTALPEDFLKRAIAAAQGQNVDAIYVPTKEVKVEGAPNATGSATVEPDAIKEADAKVEVTKKRKDIDFAKLIKMLDDSTHGGADYLSRSMQANAQQAQANRSRSLAQIAQFDQEQVNKMAESLKGGKPQGYSEGGDVGGGSSTEGSPGGDATGGTGGGVGGQSGNTAGSAGDTTGGSPAGDASGGFGGGVGGASGSGNQGGGSSSGGVSDTGGTGFGGDIMGGSFGKAPDVGVTLGTEEMGPAAPTSVTAPTAMQVETALATLAAGLIAEAAALSKSSTVDVAETEAETQALEGSNITGGSPAGDASGGFGGGIGSGTSTSTESPSTGDISNGSGEGSDWAISNSSNSKTLTKLANSLEIINEKYGVAPKIEDIVIKNNLAEGGKVKLHDLYYKYAEGGPKLPDRPEYEMTDSSNAVDATPNTSLEQLFQAVTGGRNLQNDLSNIKSRLPTGRDYGHALLEQRDSTQAMNEQGRQNLREGYANRDIPQMLLATGQGAMGLINPAMAPINAGFDVLVNTAGKFDPRAKAEAERISLMGTEGTGALKRLPKATYDAILKAREHVGLPEASLVVPAARKSITKLASEYGVEPKEETWYHGISKNKLKRPIEEMSIETIDKNNVIPRKFIIPTDLEGAVIVPALGDRTAANQWLTHINEKELAYPVDLEGGANFMRSAAASGPDQAAWASQQGIISRLAKAAEAASKTGEPHLAFTAMSNRSGDYSGIMTDAILSQLPESKIAKKDIKAFDNAMEKFDPKWPGIKDKNIKDHLMNKGPLKTRFAETIAAKPFQDAGFPDIGSTRFAITDPELLHVPTGSSGYAISKLSPSGRIIVDPAVPHSTYKAQLPSEGYVGGLEHQLPLDVMYSDWIKKQNPDLLANAAKRDYKFKLDLPTQHANPEWVDQAMAWLRKTYPDVGYADGGLVTDNGQTPDGTGRQHYDAYGNVSDAQGGPVRAVAYDQDRVNTLAQQLNEGTYG
jgi:hypothetical protein